VAFRQVSEKSAESRRVILLFTTRQLEEAKSRVEKTDMTSFEYKVVPAPKKGAKSWGLRSREDRFATALAKVMNDLAADGWEYQRSDTLPSEEKSGFRGKTTVFQNMLVFRREVADAVAQPRAKPEAELPPEPKLARNEPRAEPRPEPRPEAEPRVATMPEPANAARAEPKLPVFMRPERGDKPDVAAE
jgi:hypothetical protein